MHRLLNMLISYDVGNLMPQTTTMTGDGFGPTDENVVCRDGLLLGLHIKWCMAVFQNIIWQFDLYGLILLYIILYLLEKCDFCSYVSLPEGTWHKNVQHTLHEDRNIAIKTWKQRELLWVHDINDIDVPRELEH